MKPRKAGETLKSRPFCGKKPTVERSGPGNLVWYIECDSPLTENAEHLITLQCGGTRAEAIAAWNARKSAGAH